MIGFRALDQFFLRAKEGLKAIALAALRLDSTASEVVCECPYLSTYEHNVEVHGFGGQAAGWLPPSCAPRVRTHWTDLCQRRS